MAFVPRHIEGLVIPFDGVLPIAEKFDSDDPLWKLSCGCGHARFALFISDDPKVVARCSSCRMDVVVYDISKYSASSVSNANEPLLLAQPVTPRGCEVFVNYEYPELDEDDVFDQNDISWCLIWLRDPETGDVRQILNSETS